MTANASTPLQAASAPTTSPPTIQPIGAADGRRDGGLEDEERRPVATPRADRGQPAAARPRRRSRIDQGQEDREGEQDGDPERADEEQPARLPRRRG